MPTLFREFVGFVSSENILPVEKFKSICEVPRHFCACACSWQLMVSNASLMQFLSNSIFSRGSRGSSRSWYLKRSLARIFLRPSPPNSSASLQSWGIATRWGVVQSVGHLTVNEDGGGSNPPAPANFFEGN